MVLHQSFEKSPWCFLVALKYFSYPFNVVIIGGILIQGDQIKMILLKMKYFLQRINLLSIELKLFYYWRKCLKTVRFSIHPTQNRLFSNIIYSHKYFDSKI